LTVEKYHFSHIACFPLNFHLCYFISAFKMQLQPTPILGSLSPSTFPLQVIHDHSLWGHLAIPQGRQTYMRRVCKHEACHRGMCPNIHSSGLPCPRPVGMEHTHHAPRLRPVIWTQPVQFGFCLSFLPPIQRLEIFS